MDRSNAAFSRCEDCFNPLPAKVSHMLPSNRDLTAASPKRARICIGMLSIVSLLNLCCYRPFFNPDREQRPTPDVTNIEFVDVFFKTANGKKLHGYFIPAVGDVSGAVVHLHGNAANVSGQWPFSAWLALEGYHVLTFDYRGFGRSEGRVSRAGAIDDAEAALAYLRDRPEVNGAPVVVFGQSIGGAIATVLVERHQDAVCGLVMDAAFSSYRGVAAHHVRRSVLLTILAWWYPSLLDDSFEPMVAIGNIEDTPKLIMHGDADEVVPVGMAHELFAAAQEPKVLWIIPGESHCSIWNEDGATARERVLAFVESCYSDQTRPDVDDVVVESIR